MSNPFKKINKKEIQISLQKKEGDKAVKKKAGRPKKIGVKKYQFTLPITLHLHLKKRSERLGIDISAYLARMIHRDINKKDV